LWLREKAEVQAEQEEDENVGSSARLLRQNPFLLLTTGGILARTIVHRGMFCRHDDGGTLRWVGLTFAKILLILLTRQKQSNDPLDAEAKPTVNVRLYEIDLGPPNYSAGRPRTTRLRE
jgi:hypothetical protein